MIGKDAALASLFFNNNDAATTASMSMRTSKTKAVLKVNSMLTLENIKLHDRQIQDTNNKFYPRINKLIDLANRNY